MTRERSIGEFNQDVAEHAGYVYTTSQKRSCRSANQRMSAAILELAELEGARVIDIGCGDGTYSAELLAAGASKVLGVDAAQLAIERARERFGEHKDLHFEVVDIYSLEPADEPYDVAVVRGILHHLYDVERAVERICRVARRIIVLEPNGYNPVLKVIEKLSPYHVQHEEKSYRPSQLDRWFERCGGRVERSTYVGLVPMFCPDFLVTICKLVEPLIERTPLLRRICCGQYAQRIELPSNAGPDCP